MSWFRKEKIEAPVEIDKKKEAYLRLLKVVDPGKNYWGAHKVSRERRDELSAMVDKLIEKTGCSVGVAHDAVERHLIELIAADKIIQNKKREAYEETVKAAKLELDKILEEEK